MRLLVTGGAGRVGSRVVRELAAEAGHAVTVLDRVAEPAGLPAGVAWVQGDVGDLGEVMAVMAMARAEAVVHLAAIPHPGLAADHVLFRTNVMGTYNVHEAAYRLGVGRVVMTSSAAILGWTYGERPHQPAYLPIDEDHPVSPHDPYGLAKRCEEEIARSYTRKGELTTVVLRLARVVFPEAAAEMRRTGGLRPPTFNLCAYVDIRDVVQAFRRAVEAPLSGHHTLFIVADDTSAAEPLGELLPRLLPGLGDVAAGLTGTAPSIRNARARAVLGWTPRHSWRDEPAVPAADPAAAH